MSSTLNPNMAGMPKRPFMFQEQLQKRAKQRLADADRCSAERMAEALDGEAEQAIALLQLNQQSIDFQCTG